MMRHKTNLFIALSLLCCLSLAHSEAPEGAQAEDFIVVGVNGNVSVRRSEQDTLRPVAIGSRLLAQHLLAVEEGASLKLNRASGEIAVVEGPVEGTVQNVLSAQKPRVEGFVKSTLGKIPAVKSGERKVDMATQSAGLTRGAKSHRKPMPYIWKVKRKAKDGEKK